jgi:hypothetical protein
MVIQALRDLIITFFDWRALRNSHSDVIETEGWRIAVTAGSVRKSPYYARCPSQRYRSVVHRKQYFHGAVCYCGSMELVCSLVLYVFGIIADFRFRSGLWQKCPYACHPITLASASVPSIIDYHELYDYPRYRTLLQHRASTLGFLFSIRGHRKTVSPCFPLFYPRSAQQPISPIPLYPSRILLSIPM